ncbi:MAG: hypothetical protein ACREQ5_03755 [Candidatus Dormibacteria bacterium]
MLQMQGDVSATASTTTLGISLASNEELTGGMIRDLYYAAGRTLRAECADHWLNSAFLRGEQWLWFNQETRRLDRIPRDPERVQVTVNHLWPASRTIMGQLNARQLKFEVMPSSPDDTTIRGARIGEAILRDVWRRHDWENLRELTNWAVWKGGTAAICVEWDPEAADSIGQDPVSGKSFGKGDTIETALSIVEMVVEPGTYDAETARWWIKAKTFPPHQVQAMYQMAHVPPADATAGLTPFQNMVRSDARYYYGERPDLTLVLSYFERPNWLRPKGCVATVVNGMIVDGPYDWLFPWTDHLNFALVRETKTTGRWTGETVLTVARPVQTAMNAAWSSILEHLKLAGNARLMVPASSVDLIDQFSDLPGEVLQFPDGSEMPAYLSPPNMPQWWAELPDKLLVSMDDIMGIHDVSRGVAPENIESGIGLSILQENDATPISRLTKENANAWSKVGTMVLQLYSQNVKNKRQARVSGVPGQSDYMEVWTGKDLAGQTTSYVPLDAVTFRSRAAQQAFAERALQMGLIQTAEQFARLADLPDARELIEAVSPDVAQARRENHYLSQGEAPTPEPWQDHHIHVQEHNTFRKSVRWETLDAKTKNLIALHVQGHETLSAEQMGEQANKAQHSPALAAAANAEGAPTPMNPQQALMMAMQNPDQGGPSAPGGPAPEPDADAQGGAPQGPLAAGAGSASPQGPAAAAQQMSAPGGTPQQPAGTPFPGQM